MFYWWGDGGQSCALIRNLLKIFALRENKSLIRHYCCYFLISSFQPCSQAHSGINPAKFNPIYFPGHQGSWQSVVSPPPHLKQTKPGPFEVDTFKGPSRQGSRAPLTAASGLGQVEGGRKSRKRFAFLLFPTPDGKGRPSSPRPSPWPRAPLRRRKGLAVQLCSLSWTLLRRRRQPSPPPCAVSLQAPLTVTSGLARALFSPLHDLGRHGPFKSGHRAVLRATARAQ